LADADVYNKQISYQQQELARRSAWKIKFDGVDCTDVVMRDMLSIEVTDNASEELDDLQIKVADPDGKWVQRWLTESIFVGATVRGLQVEAWVGVSKGEKVIQQKAGTFHMDSMKTGGPPNVVTIKSTSLPCSGGIQDEKRSKSWEKYSLKGIAAEIAKKAGLTLVYDAKNISYDRREQNDMPDLAFLRALCREAGMCLKIADMQMAIYDANAYAKLPSVMTIRWMDGQYIKWNLETGARDILYDSCVLRYAHPEKGLIEGHAESAKYNDNDYHNKLVITNRRVESVKEAEEIALQELRLKNDFGECATFTLPGNPGLMAGMNVTLEGFGYWDGKHPVKSAKHRLTSSGYTTEIKLGGDVSQHSTGYSDYTLGQNLVVRIGTVIEVSGYKARVRYTSQDIISDWLYIVEGMEWFIDDVHKTENQTHIHKIDKQWQDILDSINGHLQGEKTKPDGTHKHKIIWDNHQIDRLDWFPAVGNRAVCIFPTGSDSHGYIVGILK